MQKTAQLSNRHPTWVSGVPVYLYRVKSVLPPTVSIRVGDDDEIVIGVDTLLTIHEEVWRITRCEVVEAAFDADAPPGGSTVAIVELELC